MNNKIIITINGKTASGKSTLVYLLKNFLRDQGFSVEFDGGLDYSDENQFDFFIKHRFDDNLSNLLKNNKTIVLREVQLSHHTAIR